MDVTLLQPLALLALVGAMIITTYEMGISIKPASCAECPHCRANAAAARREQDRLRREYARRVGLPEDEDDDDRLIG